MWGCWVVWKSGYEEWMRDMASNKERSPNEFQYQYYPLVFTRTRKEIEPLRFFMRQQDYVKSAKAVKVPIPEPPDA